MKLRSVILALLPLGAAWASNVLELDASNFDQHVGPGKPPALVELYVYSFSYIVSRRHYSVDGGCRAGRIQLLTLFL
jgi:hypothetical protein